MGKKNKFGFSDVLEIAQGAADVYAAFNAGNSTNLKGAEGGATKAPVGSKALKDAQKFTGQSQLTTQLKKQNIA